MREIHNFSNTLKMWYLMHKRDLPWRKSKDPYLIWLSEIIMQQTRIAQGTSYFEKFSEEYEDVFALARADEKQVLNHWQGLGYYSRARNLLSTARHIVDHRSRQSSERRSVQRTDQAKRCGRLYSLGHRLHSVRSASCHSRREYLPCAIQVFWLVDTY